MHTKADIARGNAYYPMSCLVEGSRSMLGSMSHAPRVAFLLLTSVLAAACGKSAASGLPPDFAGTWDVAYDDVIAFELRLPGQVERARLGELGGQLSLRDAGVALEFDVDCTRPELICPNEVWPRELVLAQAPGHVDAEGMQLVRGLEGQGGGRCASGHGSMITSEVLIVAKPDSVRHEALALTNGHITTVQDATCFAPLAGLPAGTEVVLTTGFTAAKR